MAKDKIWFENGELRFKARVDGLSKSALRARLAPMAVGARLRLMKDGKASDGPEADEFAKSWVQMELNELRLNTRLAQQQQAKASASRASH